jgi:hypothetical protein
MNLLSFTLDAHVPHAACPEHGAVYSHHLVGRDHMFCPQCGTKLDVVPGQPFVDTAEAERELIHGLNDSRRWRSLVASVLDNHIGLHGLTEIGGDRGDEAMGAEGLWDLVFRAGWMQLGTGGKGGGPQWHPTAHAKEICESIGIYGQHSRNRPHDAPAF